MNNVHRKFTICIRTFFNLFRYSGEFEPAEATPEIKRTKKGDKSWYGGAFEVQADVTLKKK